MIRYLLLLLLPALFCTCDPGEDDDASTNFDREAMLENWSENIIIPAFADLRAKAITLQVAALSYAEEPTTENFGLLSDAYEGAYLAWQRVSPYMIGPGEEYRLTEQLNIYPTDTSKIGRFAGPDLMLPSNSSIQGFPPLDFMLYGTEIPAEYRPNILRLSQRIFELADEGFYRWGNYRFDYVENSGNSATSSVDRTVNDFIFWYEKHLRAGKVGIPAGVFSSSPRPELTEAYYNGALSKQLFLEGLDAGINFFNTDPGLKTYLDALGVKRDGQLLSDRINANFTTARKLAEELDDDFATQVRTDNTAMLKLYDALQANVILLKVDMLQALGINVDFVDADGD